MSWFSRVIRKQPDRGLGYLRDKPDPRDQPLSIGMPSKPLPSVDMRPAIPRYFDQGAANSCVDNAIAGMIGVVETQAHLDSEAASRRFLYYASRAIDGTGIVDQGTWIRSSMKALQLLGAPNERYCTYDLRKINKQPLPEAYMKAHPRRDGVYERITGSGDIRLNKCRALLAAGRPFVFGTAVANSFLSMTGSWRAERPGPADSIAGNHAMCCIGYDSDGFLVLNSWGQQWRDGGCIRISDSYMAWSQTSDLWTISSWRALKLAAPITGMP